jgi:hypothetical protein
MFVPSLSWQNDRFYINWPKRGVFRTGGIRCHLSERLEAAAGGGGGRARLCLGFGRGLLDLDLEGRLPVRVALKVHLRVGERQ